LAHICVRSYLKPRWFTDQELLYIDLAKEHLRWEPKVELEERLGKIIEYFEEFIQSKALRHSVEGIFEFSTAGK